MCEWAGPIIDLLLEHVSHVQLCRKLTELLDSREEWLAIKRKSCKRLIKSYKIIHDMQINRLTFFTSSYSTYSTNIVCRHHDSNPLFVSVHSIPTSTAAPL